MKIIFLDVDGVLNYRGCQSKIHGIYFVEEEKMLLLKEILDATNAKVVLSSTWRFGWMDSPNAHTEDFELLRDKLAEYGITFLSRTPIMHGHRGEEIDSWLKHWGGEPIESFVILDDDINMEPYKHRLVRTSFETGLCEWHVRKAIKMLNENTVENN